MGQSEGHVSEVLRLEFAQKVAQMESGQSLQFDDFFIRNALKSHFGGDLLGHSLVSHKELLLDAFRDDVFLEEFLQIVGEFSIDHFDRGLEDVLGICEFLKGFELEEFLGLGEILREVFP